MLIDATETGGTLDLIEALAYVVPPRAPRPTPNATAPIRPAPGRRPAARDEPYRRYELGPFTVSFVPSAHSKLLLGLAVPADGELTCDHLDGLSAGAYRCGQVWGIHIEVAGVSFYHQGSANLIDDAIRHRGVDFFLSGVAGRGFTRDFWPRILRRLEPRVVVPTHYDDFFKPLSEPIGFTTNVHLAHVPDEVHRVSGDFQLAALRVGVPTS
jgi:L-ascorbate metabolism protein UlaG (beta-lactamase superfamily)